jgi:hypothetical protein
VRDAERAFEMLFIRAARELGNAAGAPQTGQ